MNGIIDQTIIDLTMPIADHFRWKVERRHVESFREGDQFQITWIGWSVHGFTHVDTPRHIDPNGETSSGLQLDRVIGSAAILDLTDVYANEPISRARLELAGEHILPEDIVILKTCWERIESPTTEAFWRRSPYLTREAAQWLSELGIKALAMDFPQDFPIRLLLDGEVRPIEEFVTHDVLLRQGIPLIEYVCNLHSLKGPRTYLVALPLSIPNMDGLPARVVAMSNGNGGSFL